MAAGGASGGSLPSATRSRYRCWPRAAAAVACKDTPRRVARASTCRAACTFRSRSSTWAAASTSAPGDCCANVEAATPGAKLGSVVHSA